MLIWSCEACQSGSFCYGASVSDKELVINLLQKLPDNVSLSDISQKLEFLAAIREGEAQANCRQVVPHEQVKREFASWISK